MCGIVGIIGESTEYLNGILNATTHRGPDQQGYWSDSDVKFGQNRLAIIDPSPAGKQPMTTPDEKFVINYNGETYNYQSIRDELEVSGIEFTSNTDTEVVLRHLSEHGIDAVRDLNGIFSFILYDSSKQEAYLCRDRLGIKPLYYFQPNNDSIVVSSELQSILVAFDDYEFTQDGRAIHEYYGTRAVESESLVNEIHAVRPGEYITVDVDSKKLDRTSYYTLPDAVDSDTIRTNTTCSESKLVDQLDKKLNEAVKEQLVSDAPIATICSGGVDSSLITAIASQYRPDIDVYHVDVDHPDLSEREYAEQVVDELGLDMYVKELSADVYADNVKASIRANDVPLIHPNSVGVYTINELAASNGVKVLLSGEGADELFGGYRRYQLLFNMMRANRINPSQRIAQLAGFSPGLPALAFLDDQDAILDAGLRDQQNLSKHQNELTGGWRQLVEEIRGELDGVESDSAGLMHSLMIADLRRYLIPLLRRADRMSMAHSVEMRVPMLDNRLLEFGLGLPLEYKIRRLEGKYLLKKVAERYLPDEVVYRKKSGFPVAVENWLPEQGYDMKRGYKDVFYQIWYDEYFN
jgi:asparagine synthase (glutamine-hydrolysing)